MTKLIITIAVIILSFFQLNAQNGISLEIEMNDTYRVYKVFNSTKEYQSAKKQLLNLLYSEKLIDFNNTETNGINTKKTENGNLVYRINLNKEKMDIKLSEHMLPESKFNRLKNGISKIYKNLKNEKYAVSKVRSKSNSSNKSKTRSRTTSSSSSFSINIDIDNSDGNYKLISKYDENGQYEKLIELITEELGSKNLKMYNSHLEWSKKIDGDYAYLISVYKGKFKVVIDDEFIESNLFSKIRKIAEVGKIIINPDAPETPEPPKIN